MPSDFPTATKREPSDADVLSVQGAAEFLGISELLVLQLVKSGLLPGHKAGSEWRFSRSMLRNWNMVGGSVQCPGILIKDAEIKKAT